MKVRKKNQMTKKQGGNILKEKTLNYFKNGFYACVKVIQTSL